MLVTESAALDGAGLTPPAAGVGATAELMEAVTAARSADEATDSCSESVEARGRGGAVEVVVPLLAPAEGERAGSFLERGAVAAKEEDEEPDEMEVAAVVLRSAVVVVVVSAAEVVVFNAADVVDEREEVVVELRAGVVVEVAALLLAAILAVMAAAEAVNTTNVRQSKEQRIAQLSGGQYRVWN